MSGALPEHTFDHHRGAIAVSAHNELGAVYYDLVKKMISIESGRRGWRYQRASRRIPIVRGVCWSTCHWLHPDRGACHLAFLRCVSIAPCDRRDARFIGSRKNEFDLRRAAAISNLEVIEIAARPTVMIDGDR